MRAGLYVRVSTLTQVDDGFSISAQISLLTEYCAKNNISIYKVYSDEGISGQKENRPQFQAMIRDAENKLFDIILVHKFDRFARKVELSQKVKNQLKKSNVNVVSITEPVEDSPIGFFTSGIMDLLSEYYVRNLALESKKGHVERAKQGLDNGSLPYGYKKYGDKNKIVVNEEQAKIVKWIFDMYILQGYGSTKIATILNEHKIPTAVNGKWSHYTVNRILKNVKYIGKIMYCGEVYDGLQPAIIHEEMFNLVGKIMKDNTWKRAKKGYNYDKYLLAGLLKCSECGRSVTVQVNKGKKPHHASRVYYVCCARMHQECPKGAFVNYIKLEKTVIDYLKDILSGAIAFNAPLRNLNNLNDILELNKAKIKKELERAKTAFLEGVFTIEEFKEIKIKCENEIKTIEVSMKKNNIDNTKNALDVVIKNAMQKLESLEAISEKKALLQTFIDFIEVGKDEITVHFYV